MSNFMLTLYNNGKDGDVISYSCETHYFLSFQWHIREVEKV